MEKGTENIRPEDIESRSMEIIEAEMQMRMGEASHFSYEEMPIVKRCIHATADFDYLDNLRFSEGAVKNALSVLRRGAVIVTDTHMAEAGISKPALKALDCRLFCYVSDPDVASEAGKQGITRATVAVRKAVRLMNEGEYGGRGLIYAVGNAPTALLEMADMIRKGAAAPALVIGVPVGFVNVVQSKEAIMKTDVNYIVAAGRKGGSNVAAAILNSLLYQLYERKNA